MLICNVSNCIWCIFLIFLCCCMHILWKSSSSSTVRLSIIRTPIIQSLDYSSIRGDCSIRVLCWLVYVLLKYFVTCVYSIRVVLYVNQWASFIWRNSLIWTLMIQLVHGCVDNGGPNVATTCNFYLLDHECCNVCNITFFMVVWLLHVYTYVLYKLHELRRGTQLLSARLEC